MTRTTRTRITIQTERLLVMRPGVNLFSFCESCGDEVRMVTIDQAAILARLTARDIYREVEAGALHFIETTEGSLLVCFRSLNDANLRQEGLNG